MSTPQQPELRRSGRGQSDPAAAKSDVEANAVAKAPSGEPPMGAVPEDNQPGHHPETDQDKPDLDEAAAKLGVRPDRE